jgi:hypothetical protein
MKTKSLEVTRGSGNVFRDLEHENANIEQFKAILAAEIIQALDRQGLSVRVRIFAREPTRPTYRAFAMRSSGGLPLIASCQSSTGSDRASRSK